MIIAGDFYSFQFDYYRNPTSEHRHHKIVMYNISFEIAKFVFHNIIEKNCTF